MNLYGDYVFRREDLKSYKGLDECIEKVLWVLEIEENVDTRRDSIEIREQYLSVLKENSISTKFPEVAREWDYVKNGNITPEMISYGVNDKYSWKCPVCNYEWQASPADRTIQGKGCTKCGRKRAAQKLKKTNEQFLQELEQVNPNILVLEEYVSTHHGLKSICKVCGYGSGDEEWRPAPANLLRGRKCPKCSKKAAIPKISAAKRKK